MMSSSTKKVGPWPAQNDRPTEETPAEETPVDERPVDERPAKDGPVDDAPVVLTADPWALEKVSRVSAQRICQACQGRASRADNGVWLVTAAVLEALGYSAAAARGWLEEARKVAIDPALEGGVVVAKSAAGPVTVRSTAARPRATLFLALVRLPSSLRCGDEVAVRVAPGATAEVRHGR